MKLTVPPNKKKLNSLENEFEQYYRDNELICKKERCIEMAARTLKDKYNMYSELVEFVNYLEATEKLFARAAVKGWDDNKIKDEFIRFDIALIAQDSSVDQSVYFSIFDDFKDFESDAGQVYEVAQLLMDKYKDESAIANFIQYLQNIFMAYIRSVEEEEETVQFQHELVRARMEMLASTSKIDIAKLQDVYDEFRDAIQTV